jgi:ectoine hydroxylase-related dioxygenase (phytanoyl-CoA dioxygenase family)
MADIKAEFQHNGYLFLQAFFSPQEVKELSEVIAKTSALLPPKNSLDKNKMRFYSNLYRQSEQLRDMMSSQKIVDLICSLADDDIWMRWDQAVIKYSGGEEFPWHQDNGYNDLAVEHFQFWVSLSSMDENNGGLSLIPGSHRNGILEHTDVYNHRYYKPQQGTPVTIKADPGDVVVFSSLLLHRTSTNQTLNERLAYVAEYMKTADSDPGLEPPYFQVSANRQPQPRMIDVMPGMQPANRDKKRKDGWRKFLSIGKRL